MRSNLNLKYLQHFTAIAAAGSLTRASEGSGVAKATLSHSVRQLESALDVTLLQRTAEGVALTEAGHALLLNAQAVFEACEIAESATRSAHSAVEGTVRIAATYEFGASMLGAATLQIARANPGIDFDLQFFPNDVLFRRSVDFDCMIFFGQPPSSDLIARKIGSYSYGVYASRELVDRLGPVRVTGDLARLPAVEISRGGYSELWTMTDGTRSETVRVNPRFRVQDYWMAKVVAVGGEAVAFLPDFFAHYEVESGALLQLLPDWQSAPRNVYVLYPAARVRNPRVQMVAEVLRDSFREFILAPGYQLGAPLP
jgi:DNA-binding transcriptional LysR family regulator